MKLRADEPLQLDGDVHAQRHNVVEQAHVKDEHNDHVQWRVLVHELSVYDLGLVVHGLAALQVPVRRVNVVVDEAETEAEKREHREQYEKHDDKAVELTLDARDFVRLELGVAHHFGVSTGVNAHAVDERRDAQTHASQQHVVVHDGIFAVAHDHLALELVQLCVGLVAHDDAA